MSRKEAVEMLHSRVFKSVLLHADVVAREAAGQLEKAIPSEAKPFLGRYAPSFSTRLRERAEKMTYVYSLFYCFENLARLLVSERLLERKGMDWWLSVPAKVQERVEKRKADIANNAWHQATFDTNIDHTLFGDLASIIVGEWQDFEDLFPSQNWVKQRLDELERSRNVIAHGNLLADSEIERIEQYLDDWLKQVP